MFYVNNRWMGGLLTNFETVKKSIRKLQDIERMEKEGVFQVYLFIHPGIQYTLSSYEVYNGDCTQIASIPNCHPFTAEELLLKMGSPALSVSIGNAR